MRDGDGDAVLVLALDHGSVHDAGEGFVPLHKDRAANLADAGEAVEAGQGLVTGDLEADAGLLVVADVGNALEALEACDVRVKGHSQAECDVFVQALEAGDALERNVLGDDYLASVGDAVQASETGETRVLGDNDGINGAAKAFAL